MRALLIYSVSTSIRSVFFSKLNSHGVHIECGPGTYTVLSITSAVRVWYSILFALWQLMIAIETGNAKFQAESCVREYKEYFMYSIDFLTEYERMMSSEEA